MNELYLYHHGIKGMKWGIRKAINTASSIGRKAHTTLSARHMEGIQKRVKDNDKRVKMYGKTAVKVSDAMAMVHVESGRRIAVNVIKSIGKAAILGFANNPKVGRGHVAAANILTKAAVTAVNVSAIKTQINLGHDIILADNYDARHPYTKKKYNI